MNDGRQLHELIHNILIQEWDPIGVRDIGEAEDEYDSYIPGIIRLLDSGAGVTEVSQHLQRIETERMELPGNPRRITLIAERLFAVYSEQT